MKKEYRSPLISNPLRSPAQSIEEEMNRVFVEEVIPYIAYPVLFSLWAIWSWGYWLEVIEPGNPMVITVVALGTIIYSCFRMIKTRERLNSLRLGRDGEKAVGQTLEGLRKYGYRIFHDMVGDGFNLDHVIVCERGVYSIETKTRSKPKRGSCRIIYDRNGLSMNGMKKHDMDTVVQAKAQKRWLERLIKNVSGVNVTVLPVVLFPGWFVENREGNIKHKVWVLEIKALPAYIRNQPQILTAEQVNIIAKGISGYIRDTYEQIPNR